MHLLNNFASQPLRLLFSSVVGSLLGAAILQLAGCGGGGVPPLDISQFTRPYSYLVSARPTENWDRIWPQTSYVIRNATELRTAWESRTNAVNTMDPLPNIDFSRFTLLGLSQGGGSACTDLRITRVRQVDNTLLVESELQIPAEPVGCIAAIRPVFDFVQIPATAQSVQFLPTVTTPNFRR